ncbi:MAG: hypothetical protein KDC49_04210 [Saprospiraceae bacterium]|nr:hypothetical protein [Saprospiraceae bacterium]
MNFAIVTRDEIRDCFRVTINLEYVQGGGFFGQFEINTFDESNLDPNIKGFDVLPAGRIGHNGIINLDIPEGENHFHIEENDDFAKNFKVYPDLSKSLNAFGLMVRQDQYLKARRAYVYASNEEFEKIRGFRNSLFDTKVESLFAKELEAIETGAKQSGNFQKHIQDTLNQLESEFTNKSLWLDYFNHYHEFRGEKFGLLHSGSVINFQLLNNFLPVIRKKALIENLEELVEAPSTHEVDGILSNYFKDISAYKKVMELMVSQNLVQAHVYRWKDEKGGTKGLLVAIIKSLSAKNYTKKRLRNAQIEKICLVTFGLDVSIDWVKQTKAEAFSMETDFIPTYI